MGSTSLKTGSEVLGRSLPAAATHPTRPRANRPDGAPPRFSFDAARVVLRTAESCDPTDRALAADTAGVLAQPVAELRGTYALDGTATVDWQHPLVLTASAAARTAVGDTGGAATTLDAAAALDERTPSYFGGAWVALGRVLLQTSLLGSCPGGSAGQAPSCCGCRVLGPVATLRTSSSGHNSTVPSRVVRLTG